MEKKLYRKAAITCLLLFSSTACSFDNGIYYVTNNNEKIEENINQDDVTYEKVDSDFEGKENIIIKYDDKAEIVFCTYLPSSAIQPKVVRVENNEGVKVYYVNRLENGIEGPMVISYWKFTIKTSLDLVGEETTFQLIGVGKGKARL